MLSDGLSSILGFQLRDQPSALRRTPHVRLCRRLIRPAQYNAQVLKTATHTVGRNLLPHMTISTDAVQLVQGTLRNLVSPVSGGSISPLLCGAGRRCTGLLRRMRGVCNARCCLRCWHAICCNAPRCVWSCRWSRGHACGRWYTRRCAVDARIEQAAWRWSEAGSCRQRHGSAVDPC